MRSSYHYLQEDSFPRISPKKEAWRNSCSVRQKNAVLLPNVYYTFDTFTCHHEKVLADRGPLSPPMYLIYLLHFFLLLSPFPSSSLVPVTLNTLLANDGNHLPLSPSLIPNYSDLPHTPPRGERFRHSSPTPQPQTDCSRSLTSCQTWWETGMMRTRTADLHLVQICDVTHPVIRLCHAC